MEASVHPTIRIERVGSTLHVSAQFTAPVDEATAQQRLHEFLQRVGFTYDSQASRWTRGSLLGNLTSLQPRALKAAVETRLTPASGATTVDLNLSVSLFGQVLTDAQVEAFEAELREAARYVCEGQADLDQLSRRYAAMKSLLMFAAALSLAISIAVIVGLVIVMRPLLVELGVSRSGRIFFNGVLGGAIAGVLMFILMKRMLRSPR